MPPQVSSQVTPSVCPHLQGVTKLRTPPSFRLVYLLIHITASSWHHVIHQVLQGFVAGHTLLWGNCASLSFLVPGASLLTCFVFLLCP